MAHSEFVGVDACPRGWFSIGLNTADDHELEVFSSFEKLLDHYSDAKLILVDIPIGLPEDGRGRKCDGVAWRKLGWPRGMSVFPTPTRQAAHQAAKSPRDHDTATKVEMQFSGKGLSSQTFGIARKIAEVDQALLNTDRKANPEIREVHPEFCFWALNNGWPLKYGKTDKKGECERLSVLREVDACVDAVFRNACTKYLRKDAKRDDVIDALVAAVTAKMGWPHQFKTLPKKPKRDPKGLPMEMVYWRP